MAGENFTLKLNLEQFIVNAIKQPGREMLYDSSHKQYRNNSLKLRIWTEIGNSAGVSKDTCQKIWKNLKAKYRMVLRTEGRKRGNAVKKLKPHVRWLQQELKFLRKFVDDSEPKTNRFVKAQVRSPTMPYDAPDDFASGNSSGSPSTSTSLEQTRVSNGLWKALEDLTNGVENYVGKIEQCADFLSTPKQELDPFVVYIDYEMKKVPQPKRNQLKLQILKSIYDAQEK